MMEMHTIDIVPLLEELRGILERTLRENVKIVLDLEPNRPLKLKADPARLQQILMNLAVNAHEAMAEGGKLTLSLAELQVESGRPLMPGMEPGEWMRLSVADTGDGIPPENLAHIFEPFFTTKEPGKGTGLGLAQVYGLVKQHSGYIDVESTVGKGTTFSVYFPALPDSAELSQVAEEPSGFVGHGEWVLVVEDDPVLRRALTDALEALNLHSLHAEDGADGLQLYRREQEKIELVVSDLIMPEMGGRKLLQELRRIDPDVKMVFMTGYPLGSQTYDLYGAKQVTWIRKPFTVNELSRAIGRVLR
jgi:CheY-like chemotaxis protein/two-component sensor histidine kinase